MLPIYKAASYQGLMSGGSTNPWLVLVEINQKPRPYVAKLYKSNYVNSFKTIAKEVYSSVLAERFGIKTPSPALIEFPDRFLNSLDVDQKKSLVGKHINLTFGTALISSSFPFQLELEKEYLWKHDIETIYAFDNPIKNSDRKIGKPNLLIKTPDMYVIDHEQTFLVNKRTLELFDENTWVYWKDQHIFYSFLKERGVETKRNFFHHFLELLNEINFDFLDPYHYQLVSLGLDDEENYYQIKEYLCYMKNNSDRLVSLLRGELG